MTALVRAPAPIAEQTRARAWVELFAPAVELSKQIASTEFVPKGLRDNVPAITAAILYGDEIGLEPMTALAMIAVIDGKPYVSAEGQRALVLAAGHELWLDEATNQRVTWAGRRVGTDQVSRITWTMDDARTAGLVGKVNWRNYPRAMLSARSSAELVRALFADVIHGLGATEEYDDAFGLETARVPADDGGGSNKRKRAPRLASPAPAPAPATIEAAAPVPATATSPPQASARPAAVPPLPGEIPDTRTPTHRTEAQKRKILATFADKGVKGTGSRAARIQLMRTWTGRPTIESGDDLTFDEASTVIDQLEAWEGVK